MSHPKHWHLLPPAPAAFLTSATVHPLLAQVLWNRGLHSAAEIETFLGLADAVAANPFRLIDMNPAVARIVQAIRKGETICIYGDFDADGVTATTLLVEALAAAGARIGAYIPDRVDEGYGLNVDAVQRIAQKAQLLITVDCGIRSIPEVLAAKAAGMDVIITDHHTLGAELPPALAVINPRRTDGPRTFDKLAGVGVAYRLAQAVLRAMSRDEGGRLSPDQVAEIEEMLLDLVALGTVADMMPLLGENRTLVRRGLAQINHTERVGLQALMLKADLRPGSVDATAISFRLAPRINAAGRMASAQIAYQLLRTHEATDAQQKAAQLEDLNQRRRSITEQAHAEAEQLLAGQLTADAPILIVGSNNFQPGIVGLVAGKLAERFYRPTVVMERGPDETRGSARSIPEFDISQALDRVSPLLIRHGGHHSAAGFAVKTGRVDEFTEALTAVAAGELAAYPDLRPSLTIDAETTLEQLSWNLLEQFARLEPTGQENEAPVLLVRNCRIHSRKTVGGGKHLKLTLQERPGGGVFEAVGFHLGDRAAELAVGAAIDVVFTLELNEWQGAKRIQLNLGDVRSAQSAGEGASV